MPEVRLKPAVASQGRSGAAPTNPRQTGPKARMTVSRGNAWVRFLGRVGGLGRGRPTRRTLSYVWICRNVTVGRLGSGLR